MIDPRLQDAFNDCLGRMLAGDSIVESLRRYPDLAADLRPMLETAQRALAASRVPHHTQMRSRARFLTAAAQMRQPRPNPLGALLRRSLSTAIALFVGFVLGTTGLYYASAETLPGQPLYGVKRAFEGARIQLAADTKTRAELEQEFAGRRETEAAALATRATQSTATPTPVSTANSVPTSTPLPTLEPTHTLQPTELEPTRTPAPTIAFEPTHTLQLTELKEPSKTPAPTIAFEPTHTLQPTELKEPSKTPEPSESKEPEKTREPAKTDEPGRTPEPTHTPGSGGGSGSGDSGSGGSGSSGGDDDEGDDD